VCDNVTLTHIYDFLTNFFNMENNVNYYYALLCTCLCSCPMGIPFLYSLPMPLCENGLMSMHGGHKVRYKKTPLHGPMGFTNSSC